jgi:hypothetical protein
MLPISSCVSSRGAQTSGRDGDSFVIKQTGLYSISFVNSPGTLAESSGITVNGDPTLSILSQTTTQRKCVAQVVGAEAHGCSVTLILKMGDVVRLEVDQAVDFGGFLVPALTRFTITRVNF